MDMDTKYFEALIKATGLTVAEYQTKYAEDINGTLVRDQGRAVIADDEVGPHTAAHILQRRCGCLDHAVEEEARIPPTCQNPYKIYIDWGNYDDNRMGLTKMKALEQFQRAFVTWWKLIGLKYELTNRPEEAHCSIDFAYLSGTILAWSHLANNTCGRNQQQRYDIRNWTAHLLYLVILHELGHLLGLPHIPGNHLMNPSIITSLEGPTETDVKAAIKLGYPGPQDTRPDDTGWKLTGNILIHMPDGTQKPMILGGFSS